MWQWSGLTMSFPTDLNNLPVCSALLKVCDRFGTPGEVLLEAYRPKQYKELINGRSVAEAGCEPILHMRDFQRSKALSNSLIADIQRRAKVSSS